MKNIIITGVAGMIGSNLLNFFLKKNYTVYGIDCKKYILVNKIKNIKSKNFKYLDYDLSYEKNIKNILILLKKNKFESIWHLAANSDIQIG